MFFGETNRYEFRPDGIVGRGGVRLIPIKGQMTGFAGALLCSILRDEPFAWPTLDAQLARTFYDSARWHGVHLLVAERLWRRGLTDSCPTQLRDLFSTSLRSQLAAEELARHELRRVLDELGSGGIRTLIFKGTALAYAEYSDAVLRPRVDTDVLVDVAGRKLASAVLERLGYERWALVPGDLVMHQAPYARIDPNGVRHVIDLHWKVSNPQVFARALPFESLLAGGVAIPELGDYARGPHRAHSLALACVHLIAHHGDDERLIWVFDIHLLAERLTDVEREQFLELIKDQQISGVCRQSLALAERRFHGRGTKALIVQMAAQPVSQSEPSKVYVRGPLTKLGVLRSDLTALDSWQARIKLLREHLFPPTAYMREKYSVSSLAWLPLLYVWRIARGAVAWCRRPVRRRTRLS